MLIKERSATFSTVNFCRQVLTKICKRKIAEINKNTISMGSGKNSATCCSLKGFHASLKLIGDPCSEKSKIVSSRHVFGDIAPSLPWCKMSNNPRDGVNARKSANIL